MGVLADARLHAVDVLDAVDVDLLVHQDAARHAREAAGDAQAALDVRDALVVLRHALADAKMNAQAALDAQGAQAHAALHVRGVATHVGQHAQAALDALIVLAVILLVRIHAQVAVAGAQYLAAMAAKMVAKIVVWMFAQETVQILVTINALGLALEQAHLCYLEMLHSYI